MISRGPSSFLLAFLLVQLIIDVTGLSINLLMLLFSTHICFPRAGTQTRKFFELAYYNPDTGRYSLGPNDAYLVAYCVVIFTGLLAAVMDYVLTPLAKNGGVKTKRDQTRFSEQDWLLVYYSFFWTIGMARKALESYKKLSC